MRCEDSILQVGLRNETQPTLLLKSELPFDQSDQGVLDLGVARNWSLPAVSLVGIDVMPGSMPMEISTLAGQWTV